MFGAVAGDMIGSIFERRNQKSKDFPLFTENSRFTDDTVLTVAVADCILHQKEYTQTFQAYGRKYSKKGFGGNFLAWIFVENPQPYGSWGNGSAMRVSPVGYIFDTLEETLAEAEKSAAVTHNHPEGIKGAQAVASAIFLARNNYTKEDIKKYIIDTFGYDLNRTLDEIRPSYKFDVSCQGSVPESIISFLESDSFEDAIRNAISLGGDSDTIACIAGSIAEAYYKGIPDDILAELRHRLDEDLLGIIDAFRVAYQLP